MNQKWNLQDIRPSEPRRKRTAYPDTVTEEPKAPRKKQPVVPKSAPRKRLWFIGSGALVVVLLITFLIGNLTYSAHVTIEPQYRLSTINTTLDAYLEAVPDQLTYELMTVTATAEREVVPTGQEEVEERARGVIEVQNTTAQSQRLIANTRFATEDGLVFRTEEPVVVPGADSEEGDSEPGTVRVEVVADEVGAEYNVVAETSLTIPGYAEGGYDELFASVTARSTEDFTGGFAGLRYEIDSTELEQAQETMRSELRSALRTKLESDKPAGFVLFENAITYSYETIPPAADAGDGETAETVQIVESATLTVPLFSEEEFAMRIAEAVVPGYEGNPVRIDNWGELSFSYENTDTDGGLNTDSISFSLNGDAQLVWVLAVEEFKSELAGEQQAALRFIIPEYPSIENADAEIRPIWKRSYPDDLEKIRVTEEIVW